MKASIQVVMFPAIACLIASGCASTPKSDPEAEVAVRACYAAYAQAVGAKDGNAALPYVSRASLDRYGEMLELALHGEREDLADLSLADKWLVVSIRKRVSKEKALNSTAEALYAKTVQSSWFGRVHVLNRELGAVTAFGNEAEGVQIVEGEATKPAVTFVKEQEAWKVNLDFQNEIIDEMLSEALKKGKLPEESFLAYILGIASLDTMSPMIDIWEPMTARSE